MSNPFHQRRSSVDLLLPNNVPPPAAPPMWRLATLLLLVAAPAIFGQHFVHPMHFRLELLRSFVSAVASAEVMLILALAAWSPSPIARRILYASCLLSVIIVASALGECLGFQLSVAIMPAARLAMASGYVAAVVPLVMLRCFTGWRLTPSAAERPLSILDLFGVTALVAVALAGGGIAENLWHLAQKADPNLGGFGPPERTFALTNAFSLAVLVTGVAWLCFRTHPLAAVPLILLPVAISSVAPFLPYIVVERALPPRFLGALLWTIAPVKLFSAYLLAGLFWNLQGRGVRLTIGRQTDTPAA